MKAPKIIAEIGCYHKGDMQIAKEMIITAATYCKADVVKFQSQPWGQAPGACGINSNSTRKIWKYE